MELIDNKALRISVPHELAREIQQRIFKVEVLEKRENVTSLLVHWGIDEMTMLNRLCQFKDLVPSPISRDYKWSGKFQPFDHQKTTSEFLSVQPRAFCFNEAGTGKTFVLYLL